MRDAVRGRLMESAKVNSVIPLNNDDVAAIIEKKNAEWDAFAVAS